PVVVTGDRVELDVTVAQLDQPDTVLALTVAPLDGRPTVTAQLGALSRGRRTYAASVPCAAGCRLVELNVRVPPTVGPTLGPTAAWRTAAGASASPGAGGGVTFTLPAGPRAGAGALRPDDGLAALPVVATGPLPPSFTSFNKEAVAVTVVGTAARLPRLGDTG